MKKEDSKKLGIAVAIVIVILIAISVIYKTDNKTGGSSGGGQYDSVAQCLTDKGVKMYGAYWCPHCQAQKKDFGKSFELIDYVECAEGTNGQTQVCTDAGIEGYPTWVFADGTRLEGEQTINKLAQTAGCEMPEQQK